MLKNIWKPIEKAQFVYEKNNLFLSLLTCPFFLMRNNLYKNIKELAPRLKGSILDFGCGKKPYRHLFTNCTQYIGVDIENEGHDHSKESVDIYYDGKILPFDNDQFDNVFSSEVIEHIIEIDDTLKEINRVLKPGGLLMITTPFVWNENELPHDYARYTSVGLIKLLSKHGFKTLTLKKSSNYIEILYQMKAEYYRHHFSKYNSWFVDKIVQLTFVLPQSIKGIVLGKIFPNNWSYYGNNIVICKKVGASID